MRSDHLVRWETLRIRSKMDERLVLNGRAGGSHAMAYRGLGGLADITIEGYQLKLNALAATR